MKIIEKYLLIVFLKRLLSALLILVLLFVFNTVWVFIDELSGKSLDLLTILKFIFFVIPSMLSFILPLSILLSTLLTYYSLNEKFELTAIASSGVFVLRASRAVIPFVFCIALFSIYLSNTVIPYCEHKVYNMRKNIALVKPNMIIQEKIFNQFDDMNILVEKKYGEDKNFLKNVLIHKQDRDNPRDNIVVIAERGSLTSSQDKFLKFVLNNGSYYKKVAEDDLLNPHNGSSQKQGFSITNFNQHTYNIDLSIDLDNDSRTTYKMLNFEQLRDNIRVISKTKRKERNRRSERVQDFFFPSRLVQNKTNENGSSFSLKPNKIGNLYLKYSSVFPLSHDENISDLYKTLVLSDKSIKKHFKEYLYEEIDYLKSLYVKHKKDDNTFMKRFNGKVILFYERFSISFACILFFFTAISLGLALKKGGFALSTMIGMGIFLFYYFFGVGTKSLANNLIISPFLGIYMPLLLLLPIVLFLVFRFIYHKKI